MDLVRGLGRCAISEDVTAKVVRLNANGTQSTIVASALFQLDKREAPEQGGYEGAEAHFTYDAYTTQIPISDPQLIRQNDLMVDLVLNDPNTGIPRQWHVKNDPEMFLDGHWELLVTKPRGN